MLEMGQTFGWVEDSPECKDYLYNYSAEVKPLIFQANKAKQGKNSQYEEYKKRSDDIRLFCSEIEDQGELNSCTANVVVGMLEYFQNKVYSERKGYLDQKKELSRLFLYQQARKMMEMTGQEDLGVSLKATTDAFTKFGVPIETQWPYDITKLNIEPPPFVFNNAKEKGSFYTLCYGIKFFRLDSANSKEQVDNETKLLFLIKNYLQACFPLAFGFKTSQSCINQSKENKGNIALPTEAEMVSTNHLAIRHAVLAVGYDDDWEIKNLETGKTSKGALIIRNSWGKTWGDEGYGYLPYEYVLQRLTKDWWTLIQEKIAKTGEFGLALANADELLGGKFIIQTPNKPSGS